MVGVYFPDYLLTRDPVMIGLLSAGMLVVLLILAAGIFVVRKRREIIIEIIMEEVGRLQ